MAKILLNNTIYNEFKQFPHFQKNMLLNYKTEQEYLLDIFSRIKLKTKELKRYRSIIYLTTYLNENSSEIYLRNFIRLHQLTSCPKLFLYQHIWNRISQMNSISLIFIREYKDYINWKIVVDNNKIPDDMFYSIMYQYRYEIENSYNN